MSVSCRVRCCVLRTLMQWRSWSEDTAHAPHGWRPLTAHVTHTCARAAQQRLAQRASRRATLLYSIITIRLPSIRLTRETLPRIPNDNNNMNNPNPDPQSATLSQLTTYGSTGGTDGERRSEEDAEPARRAAGGRAAASLRRRLGRHLRFIAPSFSRGSCCRG